MNSKKIIGLISLFSIGILLGYPLGNRYGFPKLNLSDSSNLIAPLTGKKAKELPLNEYRIPELATKTYQAESKIRVTDTIAQNDDFNSYQISFQTDGKVMTGQLNIPRSAQPSDGFPVIVMLRGYVPLEIYTTGVGTKNAAAVYAKNGFVTIAPDFLGYGDSDPDLEDTWESRFIKPVQVAQLLENIASYSTIDLPSSSQALLNKQKIGLWAHSNGGQIALTTLEITGKPLPTTLWAPVTAPFPYSIAFFSDELEDEGQQQRAWIALFEKDYNAHDFSLSKNLNLLPPTTIQIHHGTRDEAALVDWSTEFVQKIDAENKRRKNEIADIEAKIATASSTREEATYQELLAELKTYSAPITTEYFTYEGANHNLQPGWDTVVARDLEFFTKQLEIPT